MSKKSILLVEDNYDDEILTLRALTKEHLQNSVAVARDGQEALEYLFASGIHAGRDVKDLPHLVLLDLNMPCLGGLEVLKRLRADPRTRLLPVVILTSSLEEEDIVRSYDLGANSYIRKPVDFLEFVSTMRQLQMYWLILNEVAPRTDVSLPESYN